MQGPREVGAARGHIVQMETPRLPQAQSGLPEPRQQRQALSSEHILARSPYAGPPSERLARDDVWGL